MARIDTLAISIYNLAGMSSKWQEALIAWAHTHAFKNWSAVRNLQVALSVAFMAAL